MIWNCLRRFAGGTPALPAWRALLLAFVAVVIWSPPACSALSSDSVTTPVIVQSADYRALFDRFDSAYARVRESRESDNSRGLLAWGESYLLQAYIQMYRATGDTAYLRKFTTHFDQVLAQRDDKLGRLDDYTSTALPGWGSSSYNRNGAKWHVFIVHTGVILIGPAEFVRLVTGTPALQGEFGTSASLYRRAIEQSIEGAEPYWRNGLGEGEGYYEDQAIGLLPLNQSNALGSVMLVMDDVTSNPRHLDHARRLALFYKNRLRTKGDHYEWGYWPKQVDSETTRAEDISHAVINIDFAARCAAKNIVFSRNDVRRFARTWLDAIRRPDGMIAGCVDGSGDSTKYIPGAPGRWLCLCEYLDRDELREDFYADIARTFENQPVIMPSAALGLANLLLYR